MDVETLGQAWTFSWKIYVRCLWDGRYGLKHRRACGYKKYLDLETLVCTRGCPTCGCRDMSAMFSPARHAAIQFRFCPARARNEDFA